MKELFDAAMESMKQDIVVEDMLDILKQTMPEMDFIQLEAMSQDAPAQIIITNKHKLSQSITIYRILLQSIANCRKKIFL